MSKKFNTAFLEAYIELEIACNAMFGLKRGGVTEYINRLINAKSSPDRDEILPKLVMYRNIRNRIAHEEGAISTINDLAKADVTWIKSFKKLVDKKKDPLSLFYQKARRYERGRVASKVGVVLLVVAVIAAAVILLTNFDAILALAGLK